MADATIGEGHRTEDRRYSGRAKRVSHTAKRGDMVGDKRKLRGTERIKNSGTRTVPIAKTLGSDNYHRENGSGSRALPKSMMVGDW